jgi:hypothetical protein
MTGSSMDSSTQSVDFPPMTITDIDEREGERETYTQLGYKKSKA